jgi:hypothetical protein
MSLFALVITSISARDARSPIESAPSVGAIK